MNYFLHLTRYFHSFHLNVMLLLVEIVAGKHLANYSIAKQ